MGKSSGGTRASSSNSPRGLNSAQVGGANNPFAQNFIASNAAGRRVISDRMMDEVDEYISDNRGWIGTNGYMHKDLNGNVVATIRVGTDWEQKDDGTTEYFYSASPEIALGQRQTANERSQFNALRQEAAKQHFKSVDEAARWIEERARQINR